MSFFKNALIAAGFMTLGAVSTVGLQAAARGPHGFGHPGRAQLQRLIADLDLSEDQQAQVDELKQMMRDHHLSKHDDRMARHDDMVSMLQQENLDRDAVHAEIDARAADKLDFAHMMADEMMDLHSTMTPAQKATLAEKADTFHERMQERMQERMERRGEF
ncbi:MAG: periplasmic heavy metal sensor [Myxococcota bacterium]